MNSIYPFPEVHAFSSTSCRPVLGTPLLHFKAASLHLENPMLKYPTPLLGSLQS